MPDKAVTGLMGEDKEAVVAAVAAMHAGGQGDHNEVTFEEASERRSSSRSPSKGKNGRKNKK